MILLRIATAGDRSTIASKEPGIGRYRGPFRLHTPFVEWWKVDVVKEGIALGVPYEKTHTCYEGRRPACGRCDACAERIAAFRDNGVCDPLEYEVDIAW